MKPSSGFSHGFHLICNGIQRLKYLSLVVIIYVHMKLSKKEIKEITYLPPPKYVFIKLVVCNR